LDVEVTSALRSLATGRRLDAHTAAQALEGLVALPAVRCSHLPLLDRIWELRHHFTANDAVYIALAEATNAVLCTSDEKMCKGHHARVMLLGC
jgi:predicted nucleic acid-binding protein